MHRSGRFTTRLPWGGPSASLDEVGYGAHGHRWGFRFFLGTLEDIDRARREIVIAPMQDDDGSELLARQRISYDYLVMAIGSVSNDFGTPGVRSHCVFLEQREDAERFRQRLLNYCLRVSRTQATSATEASPVLGALSTPPLLAECCHRWQSAFMPIQITIRGVPEDVRDELAARAALRRQSMQEFLRCELERIASRPSIDAWLQGVRSRKEAAGTRVRPSSILRARDADRT